MNIGHAAAASGMPAKMIRYYESIGLVGPAKRSGAGYRMYDQTDVHVIRFIQRARSFGFPIARIRTLIDLWRGGRPSREVKQVALAHAAELQARIGELEAMRAALLHLADSCQGDDRPDCPILRDLEGTRPGGTAEPPIQHARQRR